MSIEPTPHPGLWPRLRRILAMAKPYKWRLITAFSLILLASGATLALPLGMKALLDQALEDSGAGFLDLLALGLLGLFIFRSVLAFIGQYLMQVTGELVVTGLRQRVYEHLHRLDLGFHGGRQIGDLTSRLSNDTQAIRSVVTTVLVSSSLQLFQLVGSVVVMLFLNWRLTLIVLVFTPLVTVASKLFAPVLERIARTVQDRVAQCNAVAQEALSSLPVVQAFGRSDYETARYRRSQEDLVETVKDSAKVGAFFSSVINLLFAVSSVMLFWYGGREVISGRLTAGDLVAFMFYAQNIAQSIGALAEQFASVSAASGASERIFGLLDTEPRIQEAPDAEALPPVRGELELDRVGFAYTPDRPVLDDLSLRVDPGETVALVGRSGAGKSTLLQLLMRFFDPTSGRVLIDGRDLRSVTLQSLREQVAIVSQEVYIFGTSVRENIRYGRLDASDEEVEAAARAADAHGFIAALPQGYETVLGERGVGLSGGQRQRLAIARALLKDARLLILDEATSAVDPLAEAAIQNAVDLLCAGRTTIRVTHRLSSLRNVDRIFVMDEGRIVESGTETELLSRNGLYRRLHEGSEEQAEDPGPEASTGDPPRSDSPVLAAAVA